MPEDLICRRCEGVLKDPLHCKLCKGYFCQECLAGSARIPEACEHPISERAEVNKYLKTKIGELQMCCRYKKAGCGVVSKVSLIDQHEKFCQFRISTSPSLSPIPPSDSLTPIPSECDFRLVVCPKGCHKKLKINELPAHDCLQWLVTLTASQHDRNRRLKSDYESSCNELESLQEEFDHYKSATDTEIRDFQVKLKEVVARKKTEEAKRVEAGDSSYVRFREHTQQRVGGFVGKTDRELEEFFKMTTETIKSYTLHSRQTLQDYTARTKSDASNFALCTSSPKPKSPMKSGSPSKSCNSSLSVSGGSRTAI